MFRKYVISLLLILSVLALVACGPEEPSSTGPSNETPESADEVTVAPTATPAEEPVEEATADTGEEEVTPDPDAAPEGDSAGEAVQELNWGDNKEDCPIPGLVITGTVSSDAPCTTVEGTPEDEATSEAEGDGGDATEELEPRMDEQTDEQTDELDSQAKEMATLSIEDLAQELGVSADEIEVVGVSAVDWPDASLGCPEPDMMYAQMVTPGHLIRLSVDGETYDYHSGGMQSPFLCEETMQQLPPGLDIDQAD